MGAKDGYEEPINERRAFVRELQTRDDVLTTDYTRDRFQWLYVQFAPDAGFDKSLEEREQQLGYRIEPFSGAVYLK